VCGPLPSYVGTRVAGLRPRSSPLTGSVIRCQSAAIREAWSGFLSQRPWDLFLTLTSEKRTHPEALHKRFRYCCNLIGRELYGRVGTRHGNPIEYVNGIERHKSGWPHSHAVMRIPGVDLVDQEQFSLAIWQARITDTGGFSWLSRPRSSDQVVDYVSKYVTKDGELLLSDNLSPGSDPIPPLIARQRQHGRDRAVATSAATRDAAA
jgi:hypothetical protein